MTTEEAERMLEDAVAKLREHADAVQIMVSWQLDENKGTACVKRGGGNWWARQGMAHDFVQQDQAASNANAIAHAIRPEDLS